MIPLQITLDSQRGITVLSNIFIDQYMKDANDAQIKIYLYLLRMVGANLPTDIAEIADKFNHTEKDVIRSLSYWEQITWWMVLQVLQNDSASASSSSD